MKTKFKFTTANLKSIPAKDKSSASTEKECSDIELTGLKLLSGKNGSKRFLLHYRFQSRKSSIAIGSFPDIGVGGGVKPLVKNKVRAKDNLARWLFFTLCEELSCTTWHRIYASLHVNKLWHKEKYHMDFSSSDVNEIKNIVINELNENECA